MRDLLRHLLPLFCSFALLVVGHGLLGTLLGVRMSYAHFSVQSIGAVAACYSVGFILGTRIDGHAIQRVQHIRAFAALCAIAGSCVLGFLLLINPVFWAFLRLVYGVALAGLYMAMESWLNAHSSREQRGKVLGIYSMVTYIGFGAGQFLLLVSSARGGDLFLLVAMLISLSLVPIALARRNPPEVIAIRPLALREVYATNASGFTGALCAGVIIGSFLGMGPVFAQESGYSSLQISLFMGLTISGGFILQWPIGLISDRYDRGSVLFVVALCIGALSLAIAVLAADGGALLMGVSTVWGAFAFTVYPLSVSLVNDRIEATRFVPASATLLLIYSLGMIVGNLSAGELMAAWGPIGLFGIAVVAALSLAGFTLLQRQRRPASQPQEQLPYQALPRNSPYASVLDPRSEIGRQLEFDFQEDTAAREGGDAHTGEWTQRSRA